MGKCSDGHDAFRGQIEHGGGDRRADDGDEDGGDPRHHAGERQQDDEHGHADHERRRVRLVDVPDELFDLVEEAVGIGREAEELGELADDDGDAEPVHVADLDFAGEQVGDEAQLAEPETDLDQPHQQREHPRERDRRRRVSPREEWHDGGEDQRRQRRIRSEDEHPGRAEHRIRDQAGDGGVQTGDRWESRQLRVRHALGHQDRGEHDARHGVLRQPLAPIPTRDPDPRDPPRQRLAHGHPRLRTASG